MKHILISEVMTRDPVKAKPDESLLSCAKKMVRKRVGSIPLVNKKRLVGFISRRDILWVIIKKPSADLSKIKAIDISAKKIATIKPESTIDETINKMKKLNFRKLPVIHKGELVGMVTLKDILTFYPGLYPELDELSGIKEEAKKLKRIKNIKKKIIEGVCEECGNHDFLINIDGMMLCGSCRDQK